MVQQTDTPLTNVVHAHAEAKELGLGPDVPAETDALSHVLGVEGGNWRMVRHLEAETDIKVKASATIIKNA